MSLCESPLTLIEETAHGSCRSTTASEGVYTCLRLSFYACVCVCVCACVCVCVWRWDMLSSKPVRTSTWPLQPALFLFFSFCFLVIGSHHSAFSRWFPAGLRMTCDNITVLKGQAWREPVGGLGQSVCIQMSNTVLCTHTIVQCVCVCVMFRRKGLSWIFKHPVLNTLLLTGQCKYLLYYLNLGGLSRSRREGAAIFACR